jgi:hypothetical protein
MPPALASLFRSNHPELTYQGGQEPIVHGRFPWELVSTIGVHSQNILDETVRALSTAAHRPHVTIEPTWYY